MSFFFKLDSILCLPFRLHLSPSLAYVPSLRRFPDKTKTDAMTRPFACWLLLSVALSLSAAVGSPKSELVIKAVDHPNFRPAARSLMSLSQVEDPLELVTLLDGTICLVDKLSGRVFWSFPSGAPIYSSYQAPFKMYNDEENSSSPETGFFLDYGDNWQLYAYLSHSLKVPMNIEDFVKITPFISEDGSCILGSKRTAIFVLEAKTGRLIKTHRLPEPMVPNIKLSGSNPPSTSQNNKQENSAHNDDHSSKDKLLSEDTSTYQIITVMRTDYELETRLPNGEISWTVKVAVIDAFSICNNVDISVDGVHMPYDTGSEIGISYETSLSCQSRRILVRKESKPQPSSINLRDDDAPSQPDSSVLLHSSVLKSGEHLNNHNEQMKLHGVEIDNWSIKLFWIALAVVFLVIIFCITYFYHDSTATRKVDLEHCRMKGLEGYLPHEKRKIQNSGNIETQDEHMLLGDQLAFPESSFLNLSDHVDHGALGRKIGKMLISTVEIAKGSNGTIVFEGMYEGRSVAVKRLVRAHHNVAFKEIQNLIASDTHPNIVRWHGVEYDQNFVYLSLERCTCNLADLIHGHHDFMEDVDLWKANGQPSSQLLTVMRDMVSGLVHLHNLGIIHRDLKPQNVLIIKERLLCAKLSDMGISKRLLGDNSSLDHHATGCGSSGWQAPEQLLHGRQTRAIDLFSLGCVLFYCITGGQHPFGEHFERDNNIVRNRTDLILLEHYPEALDLIRRLLSPDPGVRPKAREVMQHPIFWNSETRLSFLRDTSDRVEVEDGESTSDVLKALESVGPIAIGVKWNEKMESIFINNIGRYRRYRFDSVRDLLRVLRNKLNHYRELPKEVQELVGRIPEGYDNYFAIRFPKLLIEVYKVMSHFCQEEECFQKYFKRNVI